MSKRYIAKSRALLRRDFQSNWYKKWAKILKQSEAGKGRFALESNKFWQNAIMAQALEERSLLKPNMRAVGFGVGQERLPALFAKNGVQVMATDQDFSTLEASSWKNGQLAEGLQSLNAEGICPSKLFSKNVSYRSVDMNKIPKDFFESFDFLWSNCALGHVGSIELSSAFIKNSLSCLKPGGWAVHTTEANILSNKDTLDNAGTVFFRQKDLLKLFNELTGLGFEVDYLDFNLTTDKDDLDFTLKPEWGTSHSKLLFGGYMATQIVIIIRKPYSRPNYLQRSYRHARHYVSYRKNLRHIHSFLKQNTDLKEALELSSSAEHVAAKDIEITPVSTSIKKSLKSGETKKILLQYRNGGTSLFQPGGTFKGALPTVVATTNPLNRDSSLAALGWVSGNRPDVTFWESRKKVEYIKPGHLFELEIELTGPQRKKPGVYSESFCLALEGDGIIPNSDITVNINLS
jgi:SAM-dependent methyltransferase